MARQGSISHRRQRCADKTQTRESREAERRGGASWVLSATVRSIIPPSLDWKTSSPAHKQIRSNAAKEQRTSTHSAFPACETQRRGSPGTEHRQLRRRTRHGAPAAGHDDVIDSCGVHGASWGRQGETRQGSPSAGPIMPLGPSRGFAQLCPVLLTCACDAASFRPTARLREASRVRILRRHNSMAPSRAPGSGAVPGLAWSRGRARRLAWAGDVGRRNLTSTCHWGSGVELGRGKGAWAF